MTLPLIYALSKSSWSQKRTIINIVKNESHKSEKVREVIDFVKKTGGIEYAQNVMERYYSEAVEIAKMFPESIYKQSLLGLVQFTIERAK